MISLISFAYEKIIDDNSIIYSINGQKIIRIYKNSFPFKSTIITVWKPYTKINKYSISIVYYKINDTDKNINDIFNNLKNISTLYKDSGFYYKNTKFENGKKSLYYTAKYSIKN
jgi:hypothetical protein